MMARTMQLPLRLSASSGGLLGIISHGSQVNSTAALPLASLFSTSSALQMKAKGKKRKRERRDPYHEAQAAQVRAANLARQEVLKKERADALGDPVRSTVTPFIQSLRARTPPAAEVQPERRNFYLNAADVSKSADHAQYLAEPLEELKPRPNAEGAILTAQEIDDYWGKQLKAWKQDDITARIALERITALANGNSKDRTRVNVQRCIEEFGRHKTDSELPARPVGPAQLATPVPEQPRLRAGPDTGSSEVQIAILTTKIDKLADHVSKVGHKDKHNKRNLRVLVHRRQKLLSYLRRRERGGPRFTNIMEKLGLSDGMWKGEISL